MDQEQFRQVEQIFFEAIDLDPSAWDAFLERACAGDMSLRGEVEALLDASARSAEYFDKLPDRLGIANLLGGGDGHAGTARTVGEAGQQFGQYTLTEPVGSGGMGTVWRAERSDGRFEGEVAVKLLAQSAGGAAPERFALEGRYLAKLAHPNIARLLDAGVGPGQQPYLVLEYVPGLPIDRYCDDRALSVDGRIHLFLQVLDAVTHAHAHLIVHRDIKPSNVQVTPEGSVKLLDFGVAKLLGDEALQGGAALTRQLGAALTPEYAAPEQLNGETVTTATDVYSLGLLLWFLLTGVNPRDTTKLQSLAELRALAQKEPTRLFDAVTNSPSAEQLAKLARERNTSSSDFLRALRSDLDNIVRKALAVDPDERYETVADFAQDLRRYLHHEPVTAQAPTIRYRAQKFVRRHRGGVLAASLTLLVLIASVAVTTWQSIEARSEQKRAEDVKNFIASILLDANPYSGNTGDLSVLDLLQQAEQRLDAATDMAPETRIELMNVITESMSGLGGTEAARNLAERTVDTAIQSLGFRHEQTLAARSIYFNVVGPIVDLPGVKEDVERLLHDLRASKRVSREYIIQTLTTKAGLEMREQDFPSAQSTAEEAYGLAEREFAAGDPRRLLVATLRAFAYQRNHEDQLALQAAREAYDITFVDLKMDPKHATALDSRMMYGMALAQVGQFDSGLEMIGDAVKDATEVYGKDGQTPAFYRTHLARFEGLSGQLRRSSENYRQVLSSFRNAIGEDNGAYLANASNYARSLLELRDAAAAMQAAEEYLALVQRQATVPRSLLDRAHGYLALAHAYQGGLPKALEHIALIENLEVDQHGTFLDLLHVGGTVDRLNGNLDQALERQTRSLTVLRQGGASAIRLEMGLLTEIGLCLLDMGKASEAEPVLAQAVEHFDASQPHMTPHHSDALVGLARAKLVLDRPQDALPLLFAAESFWTDFDAASRWAGLTHFWLAQVYLALDQQVDAARSLAQAESILADSVFPSDQRLLAGK